MKDQVSDGAIILWEDRNIVWFSLGQDLINLKYDSVLPTEAVISYRRGDLLIEAREWQ